MLTNPGWYFSQRDSKVVAEETLRVGWVSRQLRDSNGGSERQGETLQKFWVFGPSSPIYFSNLMEFDFDEMASSHGVLFSGSHYYRRLGHKNLTIEISMISSRTWTVSRVYHLLGKFLFLLNFQQLFITYRYLNSRTKFWSLLFVPFLNSCWSYL